MPLEFIPNQPFIFASPIGSQPCLNNDVRQYRQLIQNGDKICAQWKMLPCTEDVGCEPEMVDIGAEELGAWTTSLGWSSTGADNATFDGSGGVGTCEQTLTGLTVGVPYRFEFNVTALTGAVSFQPTFGLQLGSIITTNQTVQLYFVAVATTQVVSFLMDAGANQAGDEVSLFNISVKPMTVCWEDDLYSGAPSWSYTYDGSNGKFCSAEENGGDLINSNAYLTDGNYHRVQLNVTDCNAGGLEVYLGGVLIGTTSGNGLFVFYGTPTSGNDLTLVKVDLFDGCVSQVEVDDYGDVTADYEVFLSGQGTSDNFIPDVFEDRLVFCQTTGDFTSMTFEWECGAYRLNISSACDSETYTSVNEFAYDTVGWDCTKVVEAWNDGTAFGFYFGSIAAPDFTLYQRLRVLQFNPKYPNASEEYLFSNGSKTRSYAQAGKARICHFDYVDEYTHDTIRLQLLSSKLFIDSYAFYFPTSDYEPEWGENGRYNLAQSKVDLEHEQTLFSTACGVTGNAICPPQQVPMNYSKVQLWAVMDLTGMTLTSVGALAFSTQYSGTWTYGFNQAPCNLTLLADRNLLYGVIQTWFDSLFSTTSSGFISLAGNILTIKLEGAIDVPSPQPSGSIVLTDGTISVSFSTIHS